MGGGGYIGIKEKKIETIGVIGIIIGYIDIQGCIGMMETTIL